MKTKFSWLALVASVTVAAPAQADAPQRSWNSVSGSRAPARASTTSVHPAARGNFGSRPVMQGQRFSSIGPRTPQTAFRRTFVNPNRPPSLPPRFTPRSFDRGVTVPRFANAQRNVSSFQNRPATPFGRIIDGSREVANSNAARDAAAADRAAAISEHFTSKSWNRTEGLTRFSNSAARSVRSDSPQNSRIEQFRSGNRSGRDWSRHVFARRSANWHPEWDRHRDHSWRGHRCRFINNSWVIFDLGFFPWWSYGSPYYGYPYYSYPYSYDYYPPYSSYDYGTAPAYDYGTAPNYSDDNTDYYGNGAYDSPDQRTDRTVASVQTKLANDGYYQGEIDGILGPETRRAIVNFQTDHGLRVTGSLTQETLDTLGL
jgi:Putative peptidoglycan binding domain